MSRSARNTSAFVVAVAASLLAATDAASQGPGAAAAALGVPVIAPGQEAAIDALFDGLALPAGLQRGDVRIGRTRVAFEVRGPAAARAVWLVRLPADPSAVHLDLALPCRLPGAGTAADATADAELAAFSAVTGPCLVDAAALAACLPVLRQRLGERGGAIRTLASGDRSDLGDRLRQVDFALRGADRAAALRTWDSVFATLPADLAPAARADVALVAARLGLVEVARAQAEQAVRGVWARAPRPEDPADRQWSVVAPRAAAALVLVGRADDGRRTLADCDRLAGQSCDPVPLADALELSGVATQAAALLDARLAGPRSAAPSLYHARIGLATRLADAPAELRWARAGVAAHPDDLDLLDALGMACFRSGRHLDAISTFEALHRRAPLRKDVLGRLAGVLGDLGRVEDEAARAAQPAPGDWARVRASMTERAARDPADTVAQFLTAVSVFYDGHFEDALRRLEPLQARVPNEGRVFIYLGMAHLWLGRPQLAASFIEKAAAVNAFDPDVHYCRSQVLRTHDVPAAARALERYVELADTPGSLQFPHKTERVRQELALLRQGKLPPLWDRPGHYAPVAPAANASRRIWLLGLAGLAVAACLALWLRARRRKG